jgi:cytochrome o ubiquinol oxidase subunit III
MTASAMAERHAQPGRTDFYLVEEEHHAQGGFTHLGFWIYLMSDCLIFAVLFATYGVLGASLAGGPGPRDLFDLGLVALNTALLLLSSITYGFAMLAVTARDQKKTLQWLAVTGLLGACFIAVELYEFGHLIHEGAGPQRSAFLSAFFALVGTHGLHVSFGILWLVVLFVQIRKRGLIPANERRLTCLSLFWHFLDLVWIGVFTYVYLFGVLR